MAAADKMCGCCGEWQDLIKIGEMWCKWLKESVPRYKRFCVLNVCESCVKKYNDEGIDLTSAKMVRFYCSTSRGRHYEKSGKEHPFVYIFDHPDFNGEIYSQDKRKLRRGLRKMGCRGKIERVIL